VSLCQAALVLPALIPGDAATATHRRARQMFLVIREHVPVSGEGQCSNPRVRQNHIARPAGKLSRH
jgi:hypothetical protein